MTDDPLLQHLETVTGLEPALLAKIVDEVRAWYGKDLTTWVRERHRELQKQGLRNHQIYPRILRETETVLFAAGPLTERQIRRMIYG